MFKYLAFICFDLKFQWREMDLSINRHAVNLQMWQMESAGVTLPSFFMGRVLNMLV